jgi:hypothetical protein
MAANQDGRAERFLGDLRAVIDGLEPPDREIARHYFFGLGGVTEREDAIVDALAASASTPRNSQGKALTSVATRLLELGDASQAQVRHPELLAEVVDVISPSYPSGLDLDQLASMILPSRPAIEDAEITLTLRDSNEPDLYQLLLTSTTSTRSGRLYLVMTSRATLSDLVVTMCPQVTEVFTFSNRLDVQQRAKEWAENNLELFTAVGRDARGLTTRTPLSLELLSDRDKALVLGDLPASEIGAMAVLAADVPDSSGTNDLVSIEIKLSSEMERRDHYCYWLADRPTFVRRIGVDWSGLTLPGDQEVRLRTTIRTTAYEPDFDEDGCVIHVDGWLVAGQGVLVTWG